MGRWLWNNVGTLALSLLLAILVWVVALNEENPIEENEFSELIPIELVNTPPDLIPVGPVTTQATVSLRAPRSVWQTLTAEQIHLFANLAGLAPNTYEIPLSWSLDDPNVQVTEVTPGSINITLESRATRELPVRVELVGEPALGYEIGVATPSVLTTTVTGPASAVDRVSEIRVSVSLAGLKNDVDAEAALIPVDSSGKPVSQVELNPLTTQVRVPITQKRGFRDVAVKVVITGQVASGYWVTNITVAPPIITVVS
ncbi:MAG: CdaR family protein, partial [Anaerolineales bacterium]